MAEIAPENNYESISRPYNDYMQRSQSPEIPSSIDQGSGENIDMLKPVKNGQALESVWTDILFRSQNYIPKTQGFMINAEGGYIECMKLYVGKGGIVGGSLDVPDPATTASFHVDNSGNIWSGATDFASAPFSVTNLGALKATSGVIGGWTIGATTLSADGVVLDAGNDKISVGNSGEIVIDGANKRIRSSNYVAGVSGVHISSDLMEAENILARGSLKGVTFSVDDVSAVGGNLMVANASTLDADMTALDSSPLTIKSDTRFYNNDILLIQQANGAGVTVEWMSVADDTNRPIYTVNRDISNLHSSNNNPAWQKGTPIVKQGSYNTTSGNKYTAPILTGLTASTTSVFDTLGEGQNNGKVNININGVNTDIGVDMRTIYGSSPSPKITQSVSGIGQASFANSGQSITIPSGLAKITSIFFYLGTTSNPLYLQLRTGNTPTGGSVIATSNTISPNGGGWHEFTFSNCPVTVGDQYFINLVGTCSYYQTLTSAYSGGNAWSNNTSYPDRDFMFDVYGVPVQNTTSSLATALQSSIRTLTSRLETVAYSTDHFVITGVTPDYHISISSPSTGTDISGASATPYFNLAGGTAVDGGYGDGGWLRLIGEGDNAPCYSVFQRLSGIYNDYQEVCRLGNLNGFLDYSSDLYGIAIGDNNAHLKYDVNNGFKILGNSETTTLLTAGENLTAGDIAGFGYQVRKGDADDSFISDGSPNQNYGGNSDLIIKNNGVNNVYQALFKFDLSSLPTTNISSAIWHFWARAAQASGDYTFYYDKITSSWSEGTVTWNTKPTNGGNFKSAIHSLTVSVTTENTEDFTTQTTRWLNGTDTNYGFYMRSEVSAQVTISSKESVNPPYLEITYTDGKVYKIDAKLSYNTDRYLGEVYKTTNAESLVPVQIGGVYSSYTGLTTAANYYVSDTRGAKSTSAGTVSKLIGIALSTTKLLMK